MNLFTSTVWQDQTIGNTDYQFAETSDPRVLALIERDDDNEIARLYDGDAINPIIYVDHVHGLSFEWVAGYDGGEAELMQRAYDQWGWNGTARRYLWIFHGIAADNASGGYDRSGNWIVATSRKYREHVGVAEEPATYDEAIEDVLAIRDDLTNALDGYVYGVGYATNEKRLMHSDEDIDLDDWDVEIQCWGFVGEDYAKQTAAAFEDGTPNLPEMLSLVVTA